MYTCCSYSSKDRKAVTEHKLKFHIPQPFKLSYLCWKCGQFASRGKKHKACCEEENAIPTPTALCPAFNKALICAIQNIVEALDETLNKPRSNPDSIETLRQASATSEQDDQWKDTALLPYIPTTSNILNQTAVHFKISIQELRSLIHPKNIFQLSKIISIEKLTHISTTLPNLIKQFHTTSQTVPSSKVSPNPSRCLQPLNTPQEHTSEQPKLILANIRQHIVGNSRTTRYSEFDPRLSAEGDSGANLEKLKTNIEALKLEPQLTYMIYVVDAVNDITIRRYNKNGYRQVYLNTAISAKGILAKITEIKRNAPPNVILIFATTVQPDLHKYNKKKTPRYNRSLTETRKDNEAIEKIIEESNDLIQKENQPYETPRIHRYATTTDGIHPDPNAINRILDEFVQIQKKNVDLLLHQRQ